MSYAPRTQFIINFLVLNLTKWNLMEVSQAVLPHGETVPMLLWVLIASSQIQMRKVDGWEDLI